MFPIPWGFLSRNSDQPNIYSRVTTAVQTTQDLVQNSPTLTQSILETLSSVQLASIILQKSTAEITNSINNSLNQTNPAICNAAFQLQITATNMNNLLPTLASTLAATAGTMSMTQELAATTKDIAQDLKVTTTNTLTTWEKAGRVAKEVLFPALGAAFTGSLFYRGLEMHRHATPGLTQRLSEGILLGTGLLTLGFIGTALFNAGKRFFRKWLPPVPNKPIPSNAAGSPNVPSQQSSQQLGNSPQDGN